MGGDGTVEGFHPTSGRVTGIAGLLIGLVVVVSGVLDRAAGFPLWVTLSAVVAMVLVWSAMLRPRVFLDGDDLVLRNMWETVTMPLAAVEEVAVRQVLVLRVGERRYVSPAVGRPWRKLATGAPAAAGGPAAPSYPEYVEERIRQRMDETRSSLGVARYSPQQEALAARVRRRPAWPEVAALAVSVLALAAALILG